MEKEINSKRSQSEIVSSVLLILLVIVAAMLIFSFVIPFVKGLLRLDCSDVAGKVEISSGYTCYDDAKNITLVQVHVLEIRKLIDGVAIELGGASTDNFKITNGTSFPGAVSMCNGNTILEIPPSDNTERTYVINSTSRPNVIRVYPILKGDSKVCDVSDTVIEIGDCSASQKCP